MKLKVSSFLFCVCFIVFVSNAFCINPASWVDDILKAFQKSKVPGRYTDDVIRGVNRGTAERIVSKYGDDFVKAAEKSPSYLPDIMKIAETYKAPGLQLIKRYGDDGVKALINYGDDAIKAVSKYGDDVGESILKSMNKYSGGIDGTFFSQYGPEILKLDSKLSRQAVIATAQAAKMGSAEKIFSTMGKYGDKIVQYIEKHPKFFVGMGLSAAIYKVITTPELLKIPIGPLVDLPGKILDAVVEIVKSGYIQMVLAIVTFIVLVLFTYRRGWLSLKRSHNSRGKTLLNPVPETSKTLTDATLKSDSTISAQVEVPQEKNMQKSKKPYR